MAKKTWCILQVGSRGRYARPVAKPAGFTGVGMNPASSDNAEPPKLDTGPGQTIRYSKLSANECLTGQMLALLGV